jgi:hypothetical protein
VLSAHSSFLHIFKPDPRTRLDQSGNADILSTRFKLGGEACAVNLRLLSFQKTARVTTAADGRGPLVRLLLILALLELDLWWLRAADCVALRVLVYAAIAGIVALSQQNRQQADSHRMRSLLGAWSEAFFTTLMLATIVALVGGWLREPYEDCWEFLQRKSIRELLPWIVLKGAVVAGQQFALQRFVWPACKELIRNRSAATFLAAAVFGLLHLPNPVLALVCTVGAMVWITLFRRAGRLGPLILSHLTLAVLLHALWPDRLHHDLRVGSEALTHMQHRKTLQADETRTLIRHFVSDGYYTSRGGTDEAFLRGLYADFLGRSPTPLELEAWTSRPLGPTRAKIVEAFLTTTERRQAVGMKAKEVKTKLR